MTVHDEWAANYVTPQEWIDRIEAKADAILASMPLFTTPDQARAYILDHDRYAKTCSRQTVAQLRSMYAAKLRADGITVLIGGPAIMGKDELINALVDHDYPHAAKAREVYYASIGA